MSKPYVSDGTVVASSHKTSLEIETLKKINIWKHLKYVLPSLHLNLNTDSRYDVIVNLANSSHSDWFFLQTYPGQLLSVIRKEVQL